METIKHKTYETDDAIVTCMQTDNKITKELIAMLGKYVEVINVNNFHEHITTSRN